METNKPNSNQMSLVDQHEHVIFLPVRIFLDRICAKQRGGQQPLYKNKPFVNLLCLLMSWNQYTFDSHVPTYLYAGSEDA